MENRAVACTPVSFSICATMSSSSGRSGLKISMSAEASGSVRLPGGSTACSGSATGTPLALSLAVGLPLAGDVDGAAASGSSPPPPHPATQASTVPAAIRRSRRNPPTRSG